MRKQSLLLVNVLMLIHLITSPRVDAVDGKKVRYLRSAVVINPVDLASNEDADLAVLPPLLVGQQVGEQQGQTWTGHIKHETSNRCSTSREHVLRLSWWRHELLIEVGGGDPGQTP